MLNWIKASYLLHLDFTLYLRKKYISPTKNHKNTPFLIFQIPGVDKKLKRIKKRIILNRVEFSNLNFLESGRKVKKIINEKKERPKSPNFIIKVTRKLCVREWFTIEYLSKNSLYTSIDTEYPEPRPKISSIGVISINGAFQRSQ